MIQIVSLVFDIFFNKVINNKSLFLPLLTLISIIFLKKDSKYYIKVQLLGMVYDLLFSNLYFINIILFFFIGYLSKIYLRRFNDSIFSYLILSILVLTIYQFLFYIISLLIGESSYNIYEFLYIIYHYYLLNIIYTIILYFIKIRLRN